ncbi:hypothetical protein [Streptomyces coelicoflavus]|uniref:hypothetical protein n=1 Tax=Streptomyces coelicoflavus TaxID=285562 RepID=UPI0036AAE0FA
MRKLGLRGEEELKGRGYEPGGRRRHNLLREWATSVALARAWSQELGGTGAEKEGERLRGIQSTAFLYLREAGEGRRAGRIERGLNGR